MNEKQEKLQQKLFELIAEMRESGMFEWDIEDALYGALGEYSNEEYKKKIRSKMTSILAKVQKELRELGLKTDSRNPHFKNEYLSLPGLLEAVIPVLEENHLFLVQELSHVGETPALRTSLLYVNENEDTEIVSDETIPLVLDRQSPQAVGSAITYYRRYAILTLFNLVAESDDDGEKAESRPVADTRKYAKSSLNPKPKRI